MELTREQSKMVGESWECMEKDVEMHGMRLFKYIFEDAPGTQGLFRFLKPSEMPPEENPDIRKHAATVFRLLGETVVKLNDMGHMEALKPVLQPLGARHFGYGVQPDHFKVAGRALQRTLEDAFGDDLRLEVRLAWAQAFEEVSKMMKRGLGKGAKTRVAKLLTEGCPNKGSTTEAAENPIKAQIT